MREAMSRAEFLRVVQSRVARVAVGASAVRGRGNAGSVAAARAYFRDVRLRRFGVRPVRFRKVLDEVTEELRSSLPRTARHWGLARKLLNIFLRDALYTTHLNEAFDLSKAEGALEVPLDSITARHLRKVAGPGGLPRWPGVRFVDPSLSSQYQEVATAEAARKGIARVHLDALWWSMSRDD